MPTNFNGQLKSNEIFASIYNMIISQQVFADNIKSNYSSLLSKAKVDGGLYGDTKLYYSTDVLKSTEWGKDAEATNLLQLHRPGDPECQAISLSVFRQISLTVDSYLSKRAWADESAFNSFNSAMKGWIKDTKKVYDETTYNTFIGTHKAEGAKQNITWTLTADAEGQSIAENMANLLTELKDFSRDYNDYGNLRSYSDADIMVIWNSKWVNKVKKIDLPTLFHKEGLINKFEQEVLPARYFGTVNSADTAGDGTTVRALVEFDGSDGKHYFPGDIVPSEQKLGANKTYTTDEDIICKIVVKLPPMMSAFEVGTSFFNPKSLTENHYLTWGHNILDHLYNYPFITVKKGA